MDTRREPQSVGHLPVGANHAGDPADKPPRWEGRLEEGAVIAVEDILGIAQVAADTPVRHIEAANIQDKL